MLNLLRRLRIQGNVASATPQQRLMEVARRIQNTLTRAGYFHKTADGRIQTVRFSQISLTPSQDYGLLVVDVFKLPIGVSISRLTQPKVTEELSRAVGLPVRLWGTKGIVWAVALNPPPAHPLPRRVDLDLSLCPHGQYIVPIGVGRHGPVVRCLGTDTGHILIGGESGGGKSTLLHVLITSLIARHTPAQLRIGLVDPKAVEFQAYRGVPHLLRDIATEVETATDIIRYLVQHEFPLRQELYAGVLAKNLPEYNALAVQRGEAPLPMIVLIIDEVTDIAMLAGTKSPFFRGLIRLISKARSYGIVLVLATQNPKAQVINTLVTSNCSTRIAFRVVDYHHSQTILGQTGAEKLPRTIPGRMLARIGDAGLLLLQGYYVDTQRCLDIARSAGARDQAAPAGLTDIQRAMVIYALEYLDGAFAINKLYARFKGAISKRQIEKFAQELEARGLLTPPQGATVGRYVTDTLAAMVRVENVTTVASPTAQPQTSGDLLAEPIRVSIPQIL